MQVLHQRQLVEKRAARDQSAADKLNIENLTHDVENERNVVDANPPKSPRTFKFPKWPGTCPGSPLLPHSPLKMLATRPTSPAGNQVCTFANVYYMFRNWFNALLFFWSSAIPYVLLATHSAINHQQPIGIDPNWVLNKIVNFLGTNRDLSEDRLHACFILRD